MFRLYNDNFDRRLVRQNGPPHAAVLVNYHRHLHSYLRYPWLPLVANVAETSWLVKSARSRRSGFDGFRCAGVWMPWVPRDKQHFQVWWTYYTRGDVWVGSVLWLVALFACQSLFTLSSYSRIGIRCLSGVCQSILRGTSPSWRRGTLVCSIFNHRQGAFIFHSNRKRLKEAHTSRVRFLVHLSLA